MERTAPRNAANSGPSSGLAQWRSGTQTSAASASSGQLSCSQASRKHEAHPSSYCRRQPRPITHLRRKADNKLKPKNGLYRALHSSLKRATHAQHRTILLSLFQHPNFNRRSNAGRAPPLTPDYSIHPGAYPETRSRNLDLRSTKNSLN